MIQLIIRIARITHVPYLFSMKYIFRSEYSFLINTEKKKGMKNLNLNNHLGHTKFSDKKGVLIDNLKYYPT